MHVQRGWQPEPSFTSMSGRVAAQPMGVGRLILLTVAVALATVGLAVAAADLGAAPTVADYGAAAGMVAD